MRQIKEAIALSTNNDNILNYRTNENQLGEVLEEYDLDESLENEFNSLDARFNSLLIEYKAYLSARRYINAKNE